MEKKLVRITYPDNYLPKAVYGMTVKGKINNRDGSQAGSGSFLMDGNASVPNVEVNRTIKPTTREHATLEAEVGETVITGLDQANSGGIPEFYTVGGKRHPQGGTPLNLPPDSFIFSRDRKMSIKDPEILAQYGKNVKDNNKKKFTFADLSKQYDINTYRKILSDPSSDKHQIDTAQMMIQNYNLKLGGLAMVQESMKGFPNGVPGISMPYLEHVGMDPAQFFPQEQGQQQGPPQQQQQQAPQQMPMGRYGMSTPSYAYGGAPLYRAQTGETLVSEDDYSTAADANASNFDPTVYVNAVQDDPNLPAEQNYMQGPDAFNAKPKVGETGSEFMLRTMGNPGFKNDPSVWDGQQWVAPGTVPETASKPTKYQNIPSSQTLKKDGKAKWDVTLDGYDEAKVEPGDYVKKKDGKWYKVKGYSETNTTYTGDFKDERLIGKIDDNQKNFGRIKQRIDGNDNLRAAIITQYRDTIAKAKPGKNLSKADLAIARGLSAEKIIQNFYDFQKQIMAVHAHKGQNFNKDSDLWDKDKSQYVNTLTELGFKPEELKDSAHTAAFQATYIAMQKLATKGKYKEDLEDFHIKPWGKNDEGADGKQNVSGIDGWIGDTTIGQGTYYQSKQKKLDMEEAAWKDAKKDIKHLGLNRGEQKTPFWTEDIINLAGAAKNLFSIKKEQPWNAVPGVKLPNPTFMSPDQQIQNILGAAGTGAKMAGAFGSPQGFAANYAGIQNNAMQQVANAIGSTHDKNVQVANQFELQRSNILNRSNERRAQLATSLHDKHAILNQQFTNSKNQAWNEVREGMVNMWTNRGMTQNLNTFNDQYYIDPQTGYKHFRDPRKINPTNAQQPDLAGQINELVGDVRGLTPDMAARIITKGGNNPYAPQPIPGESVAQAAPSYPNSKRNGYVQRG